MSKEQDMATAAAEVQARRRIVRKRGPVKLVVVHGGRELPAEEGQALLIGIRERQERASLAQAMSRRPRAGDAASVRFAMRSVEHRIVKGLWVLEISQAHDGPQPQRSHGLGYMHDRLDQYANAIANGGWLAPTPRPPVPSPKEISAANEAIKWTEMLDEEQARLLRVAALTKRGDRERRVNWDVVKHRLRLRDDTPLRTLRDRYDAGLRRIVAELTIARVG